RKKFRSLQKRATESYSAVVSQLTILFRQWVRGLKIDTLESLEDLLIKEQFVQLCPPEIKEWLLDRKPETALEAGELADFHAANRASVDQSRGSPKGSSGWKPNSARPPQHHGGSAPLCASLCWGGGSESFFAWKKCAPSLFYLRQYQSSPGSVPAEEETCIHSWGRIPLNITLCPVCDQIGGQCQREPASSHCRERDTGDLPRPTSGSTVGRAVCGGAQQDSWTGGQGMAVSQSAPAPGVPEVLCGSMRGQCDWEERQGVSECPPAPESAGSLDPMRGEAAVPMVEVGTRWRSAGSRAQGPSLPCDGVDQNAWEGWQDTVVCLPRPDPGLSVTPYGWEQGQGRTAGLLAPKPIRTLVPRENGVDQNAWEGWQDTVVCLPRPDSGVS
uniref:SCAN box domain-containing protein n=1 Tax=Leptobrachium leishanense TaxID=445787 RepID=A0A8C5Q0I5_9ANUR